MTGHGRERWLADERWLAHITSSNPFNSTPAPHEPVSRHPHSGIFTLPEWQTAMFQPLQKAMQASARSVS